MTLLEASSIVRRRKWLVVLPFVLAGATVLVLALAQTPIYKASADVLVRIPPSAGALAASGSDITQRDINNEVQAASGSTLQDQVHEIVGTEPTLSIEAGAETDVFEFTATSSNAQAAAFAANTYAEQYIKSQATLLIDQYAARAELLQMQIAEIDAGEADQNRREEYERDLDDLEFSTQLASTSGAVLIDAATPPDSPFKPDTVVIVAIALGAGLLVGLVAAFIVGRFDIKTKSDDESDLVDASGLTKLAGIPKLETWAEGTTHVITREEPFSISAAAYRDLRSEIQIAGDDNKMQLVLVTSPSSRDGKSTTASNLAVTAARSGQRVLLIDCDLRTPRLHSFFDLSNEAGFTSVLLGEATLPRVAQSISGEGNLLVIAAGPLPLEPSDLLDGEVLQNTLGSLGDSVDLVILDAPSVLAASESLTLAELVDGVVLVASPEATTAERMADAVRRLNEVNASMLGVVINGNCPTTPRDQDA